MPPTFQIMQGLPAVRIQQIGLFSIACGTIALVIFLTEISDFQQEADLKKIIAPTWYESFTKVKASFRPSIPQHSNCKQHSSSGYLGFEHTSASFLKQNYSDSSKIMFEKGREFDLALQSVLSECLQCNRSLVVGVTGGSSTAGNFSWPDKLKDKLERSLHITVELRNAAIGSTSQLVTAPCIQNLVGDSIDLLFWEFAMNDEYEHIRDDKHPFPLRKRVSEVYVRQAIALNPKLMIFVHLWDLDIHQAFPNGNIPGNDGIPNKAYEPMNLVLRHYSDIYAKYLSIDIIKSMKDLDLFHHKQEILRDAHHPNDYSFEIISDLVATTMLNKSAGISLSGLHSSPHPEVAIVSKNTLTFGPNLPIKEGLGHCLMAMSPQYGSQDKIYFKAVAEKIDIGKHAVGRSDRNLLFELPSCGSSHVNRSVVISTVPNVSEILIDCGLGQSSRCFAHLDVLWNGKPLNPTRGISEDISSVFFGWSHKFQSPETRIENVIELCVTTQALRLSRIVIIEMKDSE